MTETNGDQQQDERYSPRASHVLGDHPYALLISDSFLADCAAVMEAPRWGGDGEATAYDIWAVPYTPGDEAGDPWIVQHDGFHDLINHGATYIQGDNHVATLVNIAASNTDKIGVMPIPSASGVAMVALRSGCADPLADHDAHTVAQSLGSLAACLRVAPREHQGVIGDTLCTAAGLLVELRQQDDNSTTVASAFMAATALGIGPQGETGGGMLGQLEPKTRLQMRRDPRVTALLAELYDAAVWRRHWLKPMEYAEQENMMASAEELANEELAAASQPVAKPNHIAILGEPPPGDSAEKPELDRFQRLKTPIPMIRMPDIGHLAGALNKEFPWMREANERIADDLALGALAPNAPFSMRPLLLVGPPGVGKSRYARRLAALAGVPFRSVSATETSTINVITGSGRGWRGCRPGFALQAMRQTECGNPMLLVDEIDKAPESREHGSITSALLPFLEPETACRLEDIFLQVPCDVSTACWVLTANDATFLPEPLMSRVMTLDVPPPPADAFDSLVAGLRADIAARVGVDATSLPELPAYAVDTLRRRFEQDRSVRILRATVQRALGALARGRSDLGDILGTERKAASGNEKLIGFQVS